MGRAAYAQSVARAVPGAGQFTLIYPNVYHDQRPVAERPLEKSPSTIWPGIMLPDPGSMCIGNDMTVSATGGTLLHRPTVAVGVAEVDERVPLAPSPLHLHPVLVVHYVANRDTTLDQMRACRLDVLDDQLQALQ